MTVTTRPSSFSSCSSLLSLLFLLVVFSASLSLVHSARTPECNAAVSAVSSCQRPEINEIFFDTDTCPSENVDAEAVKAGVIGLCDCLSLLSDCTDSVDDQDRVGYITNATNDNVRLYGSDACDCSDTSGCDVTYYVGEQCDPTSAGCSDAVIVANGCYSKSISSFLSFNSTVCGTDPEEYVRENLAVLCNCTFDLESECNSTPKDISVAKEKTDVANAQMKLFGGDDCTCTNQELCDPSAYLASNCDSACNDGITLTEDCIATERAAVGGEICPCFDYGEPVCSDPQLQSLYDDVVSQDQLDCKTINSASPTPSTTTTSSSPTPSSSSPTPSSSSPSPTSATSSPTPSSSDATTSVTTSSPTPTPSTSEVTTSSSTPTTNSPSPTSNPTTDVMSTVTPTPTTETSPTPETTNSTGVTTPGSGSAQSSGSSVVASLALMFASVLALA